jgi:hypothetical protein
MLCDQIGIFLLNPKAAAKKWFFGGRIEVLEVVRDAPTVDVLPFVDDHVR